MNKGRARGYIVYIQFLFYTIHCILIISPQIKISTIRRGYRHVRRISII
jgi:hypothetical protein